MSISFSSKLVDLPAPASHVVYRLNMDETWLNLLLLMSCFCFTSPTGIGANCWSITQKGSNGFSGHWRAHGTCTLRRVIPPPEYTNTTYDYIMKYRTGATNKDAYLSDGGYGHFDRVTASVQENDTVNWAANKTQMVAWVSTVATHTFALTFTVH